MTGVTRALEAIEKTADELGLPAFAQKSGVPYTTVRHWFQNGWRPRVVDTLERMAAAAEAHAEAGGADIGEGGAA